MLVVGNDLILLQWKVVPVQIGCRNLNIRVYNKLWGYDVISPTQPSIVRYIYIYDCRRFREDTSQNGDIILSNLLLLEISDFGSLLRNSWLFLLVASVKCLFWFYRNSVLSDFPCFLSLGFCLNHHIFIYFLYVLGTSHSQSFPGPKDLELLFEAAGAKKDAPPGSVKYLEFITYLWPLGQQKYPAW